MNRYKMHSQAQLEYLQHKFEWTTQQIEAINWWGVRFAKKRLKRHVSILTSKMMHKWLNVGKQKDGPIDNVSKLRGDKK